MTVAPVVLIAIISFSDKMSLGMYGYSFTPTKWSLAAYQGLWEFNDLMVNAYLMTVFYAISSTIFSLFFTSMISFAMAQKKFPIRKGLAFYIYFSGVLSGGLVPTFILFTRYLQMNNTIWIFILPTMVGGFNAIIMRTFMQRNIPEEMIEAATIDGANDWTIYWRLALPLSTAGLATIGLFLVVGKWNDWATGRLYISNPRLVPIMTLLQNIQTTIDFYKNNTLAKDTPDAIRALRDMPTESTRMAITMLAILPLLIAYPFFQRYFIKGMVVGSVKG